MSHPGPVIPIVEGMWDRLRHVMNREATAPRDPGQLDRVLRSYRRVLLVLDGHTSPERAVAEFMSHVAGARLDVVVLRVVPDWYQVHVEKEAKARIDGIALRASSPLCRVERDVRRGELVEQVLRAAGEHQVDLIVFVVNGQGRPGSVVDSASLVLRESPIPVLLVHTDGTRTP